MKVQAEKIYDAIIKAKKDADLKITIPLDSFKYLDDNDMKEILEKLNYPEKRITGISVEKYRPEIGDPIATEYLVKYVLMKRMIEITPIAINEPNKIKDNKEEVKMKDNIINIYKKRKIEKINEEYSSLIQKVKETDEIQSIMNDTNRLIQDTNPNRKFPKIELNCYTDETIEKLENLNTHKREKIYNLNCLIEEVEALFDLTTCYEEQMQLLKNYNIIDKKGKLNF